MHPILLSTVPPIDRLPGGMHLHRKLDVEQNKLAVKTDLMPGVFLIENLLTTKTLTQLIEVFRNANHKESVSALGLPKKAMDEGKGSLRLSLWAPELAEELYQLLFPFLSDRALNDFSRTDWWQQGGGYHWRPIGLSPLLRMMSYSEGAEHLPHYDAAFFYPDARFRSLMSVIFYLSTHPQQGATRMLEDGQEQVPEWQRQHTDQPYRANHQKVLHAIYPKSGAVLLFDHRIFHDAEPFEGSEERLIIRTDLVFEQL